jgi:hypothetical protein
MIGFPQEGDALYDGADKIIYAGYFPMGLTLERIFTDMPHVPFKDHVWPKFLSENARRLLEDRQVAPLVTAGFDEEAP